VNVSRDTYDRHGAPLAESHLDEDVDALTASHPHLAQRLRPSGVKKPDLIHTRSEAVRRQRNSPVGSHVAAAHGVRRRGATRADDAEDWLSGAG